jgi:hypothetical protein
LRVLVAEGGATREFGDAAVAQKMLEFAEHLMENPAVNRIANPFPSARVKQRSLLARLCLAAAFARRVAPGSLSPPGFKKRRVNAAANPGGMGRPVPNSASAVSPSLCEVFIYNAAATPYSLPHAKRDDRQGVCPGR